MTVWDLQDYQRMHNLLQDVDRDKRGSVRVAIGSNYEDFYIKTDHSIHCPNQNCALTDEVGEMARDQVKMVALGLDGCGLILSKDDGILDHIRVPANYSTLRDDLEKKHIKDRKAVCPHPQ